MSAPIYAPNLSSFPIVPLTRSLTGNEIGLKSVFELGVVIEEMRKHTLLAPDCRFRCEVGPSMFVTGRDSCSSFTEEHTGHDASPQSTLGLAL